GMPGQNRAVNASIADVTSALGCDGGLKVYSVARVTDTCGSATTRVSAFCTSSTDSPGSTRQLTVARADCGNALTAWPPSNIVATHVVRSVAACAGWAASRARAAASGVGCRMAFMSAPSCPGSSVDMTSK